MEMGTQARAKSEGEGGERVGSQGGGGRGLKGLGGCYIAASPRCALVLAGRQLEGGALSLSLTFPLRTIHASSSVWCLCTSSIVIWGAE